jgi:hypothetical protein
LASFSIGCAHQKHNCSNNNVDYVLDDLDDETGFRPLFDGETLDGWTVVGDKKEAFQVKNGTIYCNGIGGFWLAYTDKQFENFVFRMEFKVSKGANSGVFLRAPDIGNPVYNGFEMQILDDHGRPPNKNSCGSIYDVATAMYNMSKPTGQWNSVSIYCNGPIVIFHVNGRKVIDTNFDELTEPIGKFETPYAQLPRKGYLGVQDHLTEVWFRNIRIKELPPGNPLAEKEQENDE